MLLRKSTDIQLELPPKILTSIEALQDTLAVSAPSLIT